MTKSVFFLPFFKPFLDTSCQNDGQQKYQAGPLVLIQFPEFHIKIKTAFY